LHDPPEGEEEKKPIPLQKAGFGGINDGASCSGMFLQVAVVRIYRNRRETQLNFSVKRSIVLGGG